MFTGIVSHTARIQACLPNATGGLRFQIATHITDPVLGESISIDGVCLTVAEHDSSGLLSFDVSPETLAVTLFNDYQPNRLVHVERGLRVGDRLGGHWVTGHADGHVRLSKREVVGDYLAFTLSEVPKDCRVYCVKKGPIALAGISLTINALTDDGFTVMCIPHTQDITHCSQWSEGERYHVEYDYLLKGVAARWQSEETIV